MQLRSSRPVPTRRAFWGGVLSVVACAATSCAPAGLPPSAPSPLLGKPLPKLDRSTLAHGRLSSAPLAGRVVVVKFFADYCEPCKRTLPAAQALSEQYVDVAFVGVSVDEHASTAREVVARYGLTFPVVHDGAHVLVGRFRVSELPATFVVARSGAVAWVGGPAQTEDELRHVLEEVR